MTPKLNLSETEHRIMKYLWKVGKPLTATEIMQYFAENGTHWAAQTVQTFLSRLVKKGALVCIKEGKNRYVPRMSPAQLSAKYLMDTIQENFGGSMNEFIVALRGIKSEMTDEQKKELRDFWDE